MLIRIAGFLLRNRLIVLLVIAAATAGLSWCASRAEISYEAPRLLPDSDTSALEYKRFKKLFGQDGSLMVVAVDASGINSHKNFSEWHALSERVTKINGVAQVTSAAGFQNLVKDTATGKARVIDVRGSIARNQSSVDSILKLLHELPFYRGILYSADGESTLMAVSFQSQKLNTRNRLQIVDSICAEVGLFSARTGLQVHYSGLPYIRTAVAKKVEHEMILFTALAVLVTAIVLIFFFRSMLPVLFSILVVLCGVSWSLGILAISGYQITVLTALIPPLLIVIGIPNCIMLLNKYHLEFSLHGNRIKALSRAMARVALSLIMANLTTAIGFAVFCSTDTQVLFEFGLIASVSVILTCLLSLVMLPLIFSYLPPPRAGHTRHLQGSTMRNLLSSIDRLVHFRRKQVYLVAAILLCISLCGLLLIKPLGYVVDDLPKNDPVLADLRYFEKHFGGVLPLEIHIDTKKNNGIPGEGGTVLYRINKLQRALAAHTQLSRPLSIAEGIKFLNQAFEDGKPNAYRLPGAMELEKLSGFVSEDSRSHDKLFSYIDSAKRYARLSYQMADIGTGKMQLLLDTIRPKIDSALNYDYSIPAWKKAAERLSFSITGNSIIFLKGNSFLVKNLLESVLLALVLIAFVLYSLFMSPRMIAVSLLPSFLPLVLTAGLMGFAGIAIKPSTILVFSIAFGIASDGTLYFLTRYRQEMRRGDVSISSAVSATIAETGFGMVYTAVILSCGFGIFAASSFGGTAALGILISFTLLVAYCSNLILLPCFLLTLEKRITNKAFMQEPLIDVYDEETDIDLDELEIEQKKEQKDN